MTATPTPPPAEPAQPDASGLTQAVPYGPPVTSPSGLPEAGTTIDLSGRSVAGTAGKWAIRLLLPLLVRAIFRAIFR